VFLVPLDFCLRKEVIVVPFSDRCPDFPPCFLTRQIMDIGNCPVPPSSPLFFLASLTLFGSLLKMKTFLVSVIQVLRRIWTIHSLLASFLVGTAAELSWLGRVLWINGHGPAVLEPVVYFLYWEPILSCFTAWFP